jgi:erythritol transport system ATP-binding protein
MAGITRDETILRAEGICKYYPGTVALNKVDFNVYRGRVNVLVGENGAGKSTLMKILAGVEYPSAGNIFLKEKELHLNSPTEAAGLGIGIIYQEMNLFPNMSVSENIFIAREKKKGGRIDHAAQDVFTADLLKKLKQDVDPKSLVSSLRIGQQQIVEIAKALAQEAEILIMDEPTSALSTGEVEVLFEIIDELKKHGVSIIYISHRLEELLQIGDYITVLRDGNLVTERSVSEIDLQWIVRQMVGGEASEIFSGAEHPIGELLLECRGLTLPREGGGFSVDDVSFELYAGEILGIYGLMGAGRSELLEILMGVHPYASGEIYLKGQKILSSTISDRIRDGFALIPEDRQREGLVQTMSVSSNMTLASLFRFAVRGIHLRKKDEEQEVDRLIREMSLKSAGTAVLVSSLSGGNQQKVVIGKSLLTEPKILLMDEPTRGIDVAAKGEVFSIMNKLAGKGLGILFVTSEIMELRSISDRILVMSKGILTGNFPRKDASEEAIVEASAVGHLTTSRRASR